MVLGAAAAVTGCIVLEPCGAAALVVGGGIVITDAVALGGTAILGAAGGYALGAMHSSGGATAGWNPDWENLDWDSGDDDDDGYRTSHSREAQQEQADAAWAAIKRRARMVGKDLTEADKRRWHDAITKQGGDYNDILKEGLKLFCDE
ncbi:hypothetical protein [Actinoplanes sp. NPDC026619]|uniref:hypothetical protein n=1 Tax=Actinoplanes sp. NPDC026619 TaxID=3155798 RepID=UPI0033C41C8F